MASESQKLALSIEYTALASRGWEQMVPLQIHFGVAMEMEMDGNVEVDRSLSGEEEYFPRFFGSRVWPCILLEYDLETDFINYQ